MPASKPLDDQSKQKAREQVKAFLPYSYSRACLSKASLQLCRLQRVLCNILFAYAYYTRLPGGMQWIFSVFTRVFACFPGRRRTIKQGLGLHFMHI